MVKTYLVVGERTSAKWSGNYIVLYKELGGFLVRQDFTIYFAWFCFVLVLQCYSCVHYTNETTKVLFMVSVNTTAVLDLLIRRVSTPNKILYVPLREKVTFTHYYKDIKSFHLI